MAIIKSLLIGMTVLALTNSAGSVMAQAVQDAETASPSNQGGRVIEMDEEQQAPAGSGSTVPASQGNSTVTPAGGYQGVEMIVGGQGSGGVAKKATLPVVD